jgi:hypothetical protein
MSVHRHEQTPSDVVELLRVKEPKTRLLGFDAPTRQAVDVITHDVVVEAVADLKADIARTEAALEIADRPVDGWPYRLAPRLGLPASTSAGATSVVQDREWPDRPPSTVDARPLPALPRPYERLLARVLDPRPNRALN